MAAAGTSPFVIALLIGIVIGLPGLALLVLGLRGRRIDDHPRCRACGYDLSGHEVTPAACPECGRELVKSKRAIRIGHRRKRPIVVLLGAVMLLASTGAIGTAVWMRASEVELIRYYPVWLLRMELASNDAASAEKAMSELLSRYSDGDLSNGQVAGLLDALLSRHADANASWTNPFGSFIDLAWERGRLADERMVEYVRTAIDQCISIESRDRMRAGGPLPIRIDSATKRLSSAFRFSPPQNQSRVFVLRTGPGEIRDGDRIIRDLSGSYSTGPVTPNVSALTTSTHLDLAPGAYDLVVATKLDLFLINSDDMYKRPEYSDSSAAASWQVETPLQLEVLPSEEQFITLIADDDPGVVSRIREAVLIDLVNGRVEVQPGAFHSAEPGRGFVDIHQPPVNVAFKVFGRLDGVETELGSIARLAGERAGSGWLQERIVDVYPEATSVDIILRPDREFAERTLDMNEIWGGELVFEDVPLRAPADDAVGD